MQGSHCDGIDEKGLWINNIICFLLKFWNIHYIIERINEKITEETWIKCNIIDWYEEVKKMVLKKDMFASEIIVPDILKNWKRIEIFNKCIETKFNEDYFKNTWKITNDNKNYGL